MRNGNEVRAIMNQKANLYDYQMIDTTELEID